MLAFFSVTVFFPLNHKYENRNVWAQMCQIEDDCTFTFFPYEVQVLLCLKPAGLFVEFDYWNKTEVMFCQF